MEFGIRLRLDESSVRSRVNAFRFGADWSMSKRALVRCKVECRVLLRGTRDRSETRNALVVHAALESVQCAAVSVKIEGI